MTVLGIVGILLFIVCMIALAAGMTWLVVKISPAQSQKRASASS